MHKLSLSPEGGRPLRLLCLGAHADDIEIGCGGTLLRLLSEMPGTQVKWVVFSGDEIRRAEVRSSAEAFLSDAGEYDVETFDFRDSYFPFEGAAVKDRLAGVRRGFDPSLIFTHWRGDAHQDHRLIGALTGQLFREHWILEYEIPKYDGDLGSPNVFAPMTRACAGRKVEALIANYRSQAVRPWFDRETFMALARLRGVGCNAPDGLAEAFYSSKAVI